MDVFKQTFDILTEDNDLKHKRIKKLEEAIKPLKDFYPCTDCYSRNEYDSLVVIFNNIRNCINEGSKPDSKKE